MEGTLRDVPFIRHLVGTGAFQNEPLTLLDIGCAGGIDEVWREFEPALVAHAVDPMPREVARLQAEEQNPNIHYHCAFLQLPPTHPFSRLRGDKPFRHDCTWLRGSTFWGSRLQAERNPEPTNEEILRSNRWTADTGIEKTPTLAPSQLLDKAGVKQLDFIKLDVDGPDFEILVGLEDKLAGTLGVCLEVNYVGSDCETDNTLHNVDRFMRKNGFSLVHITHRSYSRAALPAPFQYPQVARTVFGPPVQGDAIYVRDVVAKEQSALAAGLSDAKLLKIAGLYALCNLPDCAAELLLHFRDRLQSRLDIDAALDLLTPAMGDGKVSYREYLARFENDMETWFFPPYHPAIPASAYPTAPVDGWRIGRLIGKATVLLSVGVLFAESAVKGGTWGIVILLSGLFLWAACWVSARIPNKKQLLRDVLTVVQTHKAPPTSATNPTQQRQVA